MNAGKLDPSTLANPTGPTRRTTSTSPSDPSDPSSYTYAHSLSNELISTRSAHVKTNTEEFAGLLGRACPAGVYEYTEGELVINSQVCSPSVKMTSMILIRMAELHSL